MDASKEKIPKGKRKDYDLMRRALSEFNQEAFEKFTTGVEEHNSDGSRGMHKMSRKQKIKAIREEMIDLWFYVKALEED